MFACCCGKDDEIETDLVSDLDLAVERRRHSRSASICQNQVQVFDYCRSLSATDFVARKTRAK